MAREARDKPMSFVSELPGYPYGDFAPDAPAAAIMAAGVIRNLEAWNQSNQGGGFTTIGPFAERLGVSTSVLHRLLRGHGYPDLATISKIEARLGVILWPSFELRLAIQENRPHPADEHATKVNGLHLNLREK